MNGNKIAHWNVQWVLIILPICLVFLTVSLSVAQKKKDKKEIAPIIAAVNAYSFSDLLTARDTRNKQQVYTLFNLLDWCATQTYQST